MAESKPPFVLEGLDHITLLVDDIAQAMAFYTDVIGCAALDTSPEYGMARLRCGTALIAMVDISTEEGKWARPDVAGGRNMDHVCLALSDFEKDDLRRHLTAHGVEIIEESYHGGARGQSLVFLCPRPFGQYARAQRAPAPEARGTVSRYSAAAFFGCTSSA
jgi:glyoxylase I family protein